MNCTSLMLLCRAVRPKPGAAVVRYNNLNFMFSGRGAKTKPNNCSIVQSSPEIYKQFSASVLGSQSNACALYFQPLQSIEIHRHYSSAPASSNLKYEEFVALVKSGNVQVIDVREPDECKAGMIPGAVNIPLGNLLRALSMSEENFIERYLVSKPLRSDRNVVFYGMSPITSKAALELASKDGFVKCRHFPGGWNEWEEKHKKGMKGKHHDTDDAHIKGPKGKHQDTGDAHKKGPKGKRHDTGDAHKKGPKGKPHDSDKPRRNDDDDGH